MMEDQPHQTFEPGTTEELIHRLRRVVLVHSIIYYRLDSNTISDHHFDACAVALADLQKENPEASKSVLYHREAFADFTGETGAFLPLDDVRANRVAEWLVERKLEAQ